MDAFTEEAEAFAGHGNEQQKIHYHHKVKDERDRLKVEVERCGGELRRMEQALTLLCSATERQRVQLLREARAALEEGGVAAGGSKWDEEQAGEGDEQGTTGGGGGGGGQKSAAAKSTWTTVVRYLAHLKLPKT